MSERETHPNDEFEGWPSPAWSGDPDEAPDKREAHEAYSRDEDSSARAAALSGASPARESPAELKEEPEDEPGPESHEDGADALDISAEHHEEEQWSLEDEPEPEAGAQPATEPAEEEAPEPEETEPEQAEEAGPAVLDHAGGELDIPPGYTVLEGEPRGDRRAVGIVISRFNGGITNRMLETALDALSEAGVAPEAITVMPVPGAFELPLAAMALAKTRRYACIVALGAVIRGGTPHFDFVATEAASGLQLAQIETGVPVAFGVLTCDDIAQAEARIYKSREAVESALEMADVFDKLRASAKSG
jgi:6,7-dimethyl-8-ribityllumazine synthase